jgi:putative SOS response-associated peptidase YedK
MTITCARSARPAFRYACHAMRRIWNRAMISGQPIRPPVIRQTDDGDEFSQVRWGFPPAKPKGPPIINFRSEKRRFPVGRCLVPASHFYELRGKNRRRRSGNSRKPARTGSASRACGDRCPKGGAAFTLLTTEPGPDVAPIHDRQMVILNRDEWVPWLDLTRPEAELLTPLPAGSLTVVQVRS